MPTKATIHVLPLELPVREIEIPDVCPKCSADLTERGSICENSYVFALASCHVDPSAPTTGPECEDETDTHFDNMIRIGYACQSCGHVLSGEAGQTMDTGSAR